MSVLPAVKHVRQLPRLIQQGLPHLRPGQGWFVAASLINILGSGLFYPFAVLYFYQVAGLPLPLVGLGLSVATGASLATVPAQGALVDRFGARTVAVAANVLRAGGFLAYLLIHSFLAFLLLSALVAIGNNSPAGDALVAEMAAPEERDRWFGLSRVLANAGLGAGGLLGGVLAATGGTAGYRWIVVLNALSFAVAAGMLTRLPTPAANTSIQTEAQTATPARDGAASEAGTGDAEGKAKHAGSGFGAVVRDRPFLGLVGVSVPLWISIYSVDLALAPYVVSVLRAPAWTPGVLFALNTSLVVLAQVPVMGVLASRRRTRAMTAGSVGYAAVFLCLAAALLLPAGTLLAYLCAVMLLSTTAELILAPSMVSLAAAVAPAHLRGRYLALSGLSFSAATAITPLLATALLAANPAALWLTLAPVMLVAAGAVAALERRLPASALRAPGQEPREQDQSVSVECEAEPCLAAGATE